jgi:hypothetical protein
MAFVVSKAFSISVGGYMREYSAGSPVSAALVKTYNLKNKGLVETTKATPDEDSEDA